MLLSMLDKPDISEVLQYQKLFLKNNQHKSKKSLTEGKLFDTIVKQSSRGRGLTVVCGVAGIGRQA